MFAWIGSAVVIVSSVLVLTWMAASASAASDDDDVDGVGGNDDPAEDSDDADDDVNDDDNDDDDARSALQFSNTAHVSLAAAAAESLFALSILLQPFLLFIFRFISVLCELEKYDVNFFKTPAWAAALLSLIIIVWLSVPSMAAFAVAAAVDDAIDVK